MRNIIFILIAFISCVPAYAQTDDSLKKTEEPVLQAPAGKNQYEIKGSIIDKMTGQPVPFATVFIPYSPIGAPADEDGKFLLQFDEMPNDTLRVNAMGYETANHLLKREEKFADLTIELVAATNMMNEVVITSGDPVATLLKKIIARKNINNPDKLETYSYEAYNKIEVDLVHLSKEQFELLPVPYIKKFGYIYNNLDTVSDREPFLPFFLTETLSDYYFQRKPKKQKEYIKATQIRGVTNEGIYKYLGKMHLAVNPYDNFLTVFDKLYVSPISNTAMNFYKYRIVDTQNINGYNVIRLTFVPQRWGENCFSGEFSVVDSVYALQYIKANIPNSANLNWIKYASFYQQFSLLGDSLWFCTRENFTAELAVSQDIKLPGFIARKTTTYKDIVVNDDRIKDAVNSKYLKEDVVVADSSRYKTEEYWSAARHDSLSKNEKSIYWMFDTLEADPFYSKLKNMIKVVATGVKEYGPIELGPWWNVYSRNSVEGNRFRFSMGTTPKLFKDIYLNGYVAYGTNDQVFKYNLNGLWLLDRHPRMYLYASLTHDIDRTINSYDQVGFDNFITLAVRKPGVPWKLIFSNEARVEFYKEYYNGFSHKLTLMNKTYDPYEPLPSATIFTDGEGYATNTTTNTELSLIVKYAYKERFVEGNYLRFSLGSIYPIVEMEYAMGLKGFLNSQYNYNRVVLRVSDYIRIAPLGAISLRFTIGKVFGTLPYMLLQNHPGNENYYYNRNAFSLINQYQYLSDQFIGLNMEHSLGGGMFNYIPLIKKLKWRQFWNAKAVIGSLSDENAALNLNKGWDFQTLQGKPYIEMGTGVENILRVLRLDLVWRVTPSRIPGEQQASYFGIFGSFKIDF